MRITRPIYRLALVGYNIYEWMINRTSGRLFCLLFNIKAVARRWSVRFSMDGNYYNAVDGSIILNFRHEKIGNGSYSKGIQERAEQIGAAYVLDEVQFKSGDIVVDCGANVGDLKLYLDLIRKVEVEYIGIEPSPVEYACLERNIKTSRALNIGLWSEDNELNFYVSSRGADSSLIEPVDFDEIITIRAVRLDSVDIRLPIKLLKIEAEGCEPEVLMGCTGILPRIQYIAADLGFERGITKESTLVPVVNFLLSNNFTMRGINFNRLCVLFENNLFLGQV